MEREDKRKETTTDPQDSPREVQGPSGPPWDAGEHWVEAFRVIGTGAAVLAAAAAWGVAAVVIGPRKAYWGVLRHLAAVAYHRALKHAQEHVNETMLAEELKARDSPGPPASLEPLGVTLSQPAEPPDWEEVPVAVVPAVIGASTESREAATEALATTVADLETKYIRKPGRRFRTRVAVAVSHIGKEAKKPAAVAVITGAEVIGTAVAIGAAEAALGIMAAFAVYRVIERHKKRRERHAGSSHKTSARAEQAQGSAEMRKS